MSKWQVLQSVGFAELRDLKQDEDLKRLKQEL